MLVYEYPPKLNRTERQAKAAHDLMEHQKMRKNMYKNFLLGTVIIGITFFTDVILVKILLALIGMLNIFVGVLIYMYYSLSRDSNVYTRIYDDRVEHCQRQGLGGEYLHIVLYFDEIERSVQTSKGKLLCSLKTIERSVFKLKDKKGEREFILQNNEITLGFQDTKAKLILINEMYEKIKYPHKEYRKIEDDDDWYSEEDLKWDKLHKHGL